jgi:CRISPR/Cas system CMR-associated protein Cmr5 small subunit
LVQSENMSLVENIYDVYDKKVSMKYKSQIWRIISYVLLFGMSVTVKYFSKYFFFQHKRVHSPIRIDYHRKELNLLLSHIYHPK